MGHGISSQAMEFFFLPNFDVSTEFCRISQKLKIYRRLVWFLSWWYIFITEKNQIELPYAVGLTNSYRNMAQS